MKLLSCQVHIASVTLSMSDYFPKGLTQFSSNGKTCHFLESSPILHLMKHTKFCQSNHYEMVFYYCCHLNFPKIVRIEHLFTFTDHLSFFHELHNPSVVHFPILSYVIF